MVGLVILALFVRIHFFRLEKEIIRFAICIVNTLANVAIIIAIGRNAPSTMIFLFFVLMLIKEVLSFIVDKLFYAKFFPAERKKLSNFTMSVFFTICYCILVGIGVATMIVKGIDAGFSDLV